MKYVSRPETVEAFRLTQDFEITAPDWFQRLIKQKKAFAEYRLEDGATKLRGCTIFTGKTTIKARKGDYIICWQDGTISVEPTKRFESHFDREGSRDGN